MILLIRYLACLLFLLLFACQNKNPDKTNVNQGISDLINSLPIVDSTLSFNALAEVDSTQLVALPDSLIDKIKSDSIYFYDRGFKVWSNNLRIIRDGDQYRPGPIRIRFYKRIPFDSNFHCVLTLIGKDLRVPRWQLLSFDKNGTQLSVIEGMHYLDLKKTRYSLIGHMLTILSLQNQYG